jgi:diguanylate cyclase (GGDEF)-like protein
MISIRYKAVFPVGILASVLLLLAGFAWYALAEVVGISRSLAERFSEIEEVRQIELDVSELIYPQLAYATRPDPALRQRVEAILARIDSRIGALRHMGSVDAGEDDLLRTVDREMGAIKILSAQMFDAKAGDHMKVMDALHEFSTVHLASLSHRLHTWHAQEITQVDRLAAQAEQYAKHFGVVSVLAVCLTAVLLVFALWLNNRVLVRPILNISRSTAGIAQGNLQQNVVVSSNDELGSLAGDINRMAQSLDGLYKRLEDLAKTDVLTGLMNRRAFEEQALREVDAAKRYRRRFTVAMVDVDHFKAVNDNYGHAVGDAVLQWVADKCRETLRASDTCFRFGGEEFVLLLQEADGDRAWLTAERCRAALEAQPCVVEGHSITVTASFGVASFSDDGTQVAELLEHADSALYAAKRAGRNRVMAYNGGRFGGLMGEGSASRSA